MPDPTFLTISETADELRVHRSTVVRLIEDKQLPAFQFGKQYRISRADLDSFMEASRA